MKKRNVAIILTVVAVVAVGLWLLVFHKNPQGNNKENGSSSAQTAVPKACDVFSSEDAKNIFGDNVSKLQAPENEGSYTPPAGISDAPKVETKSSTCAYVKGSISPVAPVEKASDTRPDINPAPENNKKSVDSTQSLDQMKKENPNPTSPPQILVNIALHASTAENAKADFNRAKAKSAQEVNGIGDSAFSIQVIGLSGKKQLALTILKGKTIVNITGEDLDIKTAEQIAGIALGKI